MGTQGDRRSVQVMPVQGPQQPLAPGTSGAFDRDWRDQDQAGGGWRGWDSGLQIRCVEVERRARSRGVGYEMSGTPEYPQPRVLQHSPLKLEGIGGLPFALGTSAQGGTPLGERVLRRPR